MPGSIFDVARHRVKAAILVVLGSWMTATAGFGQDGNNSCPVDGCMVTITSAELVNGEVRITFDSNFTPSMSKNHFHVWWGEHWAVQQVTANAETWYEMEQGVWVPTDSYPTFVTEGVISVEKRGAATTLCVTSANRDHEVLDPWLLDCRDLAGLLQ